MNIKISNSQDFKTNPEIGESYFQNFDISRGKNYMIACADERAAKAAESIVQKGGNALDAIIAAQGILSVVEPQSSGLGGGGFLLYYDKKKNKTYAWDGREAAPLKAKENMFLQNVQCGMLW